MVALVAQNGDALKCYSCSGEFNCQRQIQHEVECKSNLFQTYNLLTSHYGIRYQESKDHYEYECFYLDSTLTNKIDGSPKQFVYKGCIEKGFKVCDLQYNTIAYSAEKKETCEVCAEELCNNGSTTLILSNLLVAVGLIAAFKSM